MANHDRGDRAFPAAPGFVLPALTWCALLLFACAGYTLWAQTASTKPMPAVERPGDVYKELMRPLDQVRSSVDNWSPAELAALAAGVKRAQQYCGRVAPATVAGDDLYQLARVCSVGQRWNDADAAASAYIKSTSQPYQADAYAIRINALLNLKDATMAIEVARSMLRSLPYDATVDQSMAYLIHYLAMSLNDGALPLARERQPLLLAALECGSTLKERAGDTAIGAAALYGEGLELAYLEQYAGRPNEARQALTALDAAVAKVSAEKIDNQAEIDRAKAQYALIGQKLPPIHILHYSAPGYSRAHIHPDDGTATVLLLFPGWCAQCRKMMQSFNEFLHRNNTAGIQAYGLLTLDTDETATDPFKEDNFRDLLHTPTLTTSSDTLQAFGAASFPFVVITDGSGKIRFLGTVAQNVFDAGGFVEQFIDRSAHQSTPADSPPATH
jgi:tetratricopeptide (TPR) repeat protein